MTKNIIYHSKWKFCLAYQYHINSCSMPKLVLFLQFSFFYSRTDSHLFAYYFITVMAKQYIEICAGSSNNDKFAWDV
jgi:hypothetical protein